MQKFIKLSTIDSGIIRINIEHIIYYFTSPHAFHTAFKTRILTTQKETLTVRETAEEIDQMIIGKKSKRASMVLKKMISR
jgi:hypothetical protein